MRTPASGVLDYIQLDAVRRTIIVTSITCRNPSSDNGCWIGSAPIKRALGIDSMDYSVMSIVISEENWPGHSESLGVGV